MGTGKRQCGCSEKTYSFSMVAGFHANGGGQEANLLTDAKAQGELRRLLKLIEKTDLLICAEGDYIPFKKEGAQLLFLVISECYEKRSVIITTNLEFSKWNGIFYDEKMTAAIIDRLIHHSHLLVFTGPSYRLRLLHFHLAKQNRYHTFGYDTGFYLW